MLHNFFIFIGVYLKTKEKNNFVAVLSIFEGMRIILYIYLGNSLDGRCKI